MFLLTIILFDCMSSVISLFFFNDTATTEIYTLSLHDALPISRPGSWSGWLPRRTRSRSRWCRRRGPRDSRSEEHTSELQSHSDLVCRLLLEKKKKKENSHQKPHETQRI